MKKLLLSLVLVSSCSVSPIMAQQASCVPRAEGVGELRGKHEEAAQSMGVASNGLLMEMWASPNKGTWTITVTGPDGVMCLIMSGEGWVGV